ncbi:MAG: alpha/beta fold hydrolase [Pikeienuella sp.]
MFRHETVNDGPLSFHCLTAGDASRPLLLFLHGFPEFSGAWEELMLRLSDRFFCVAPDQRGYGRSSKPEGVEAYATGRLAADAASVLTRFAPCARAVIGHDWGAAVAYALAFARPGLMERLIIMNGVHPVPFQRALAAGGAQSAASQYIHYLRSDKAEERLAADDFCGLMRLFSHGMNLDWLQGARRKAYLDAWRAPGALTGMLNWYRASRLAIADPGEPLKEDPLAGLDLSRMRVRPSHLLLWGMDDGALLPEATEGLGEFCDALTRLEIRGADHWLHHQKPDEIAAHIAGFCD